MTFKIYPETSNTINREFKIKRHPCHAIEFSCIIVVQFIVTQIIISLWTINNDLINNRFVINAPIENYTIPDAIIFTIYYFNKQMPSRSIEFAQECIRFFGPIFLLHFGNRRPCDGFNAVVFNNPILKIIDIFGGDT